ncbi:hypothetical protein [Bacillus sp. AK031]
MEEIHYVPVPFFILDAKLSILDASESGSKMIQGTSFLDMIEEESSTKFSKYFHRHMSGTLEINIKSRENPPMPVLYDAYFQFAEMKQKYYVALISKAKNYSDISKKLDRIQKHLWNPNQEDTIQKQLHPSSFHLDTAADKIRHQENNIEEAVKQLRHLQSELGGSLPESKKHLLRKCAIIEKTLKNNIK